MRAAMFNGPDRPITIETLPDPAPGPGDVVVRVRRCGICGSDIAGMGKGPMRLPLGRFGHEWAGEIVACGRDVAGLGIGDRVSGLPVARCGRCEGCRSRNPLFCEKASYVVGGFGEFMTIPVAAANPVPAMLGDDEGALIEPMACGLHALRMAGIVPGDRVLVIGAGSMAASVVFWARSLGAARIAVVSRSRSREEMMIATGADAMLAFDDRLDEAVPETLGGAPEIVVECVGKPGMIELAARHVRLFGRVVSMGLCNHAEPIVPSYFAYKEVRLLFPIAYTVDEIAETTAALAAGQLPVEALVGDRIALDALPAMLDAMCGGRGGSGKVLVDPGHAAIR